MSKTGFIIGRFQPVHKGHIEMIRQAGELCDELVILIGSAQESRTTKNPFTFEERAHFLREAIVNYQKDYYGVLPKITIIPLNDHGVGNNAEWGQYVCDYLKNVIGYVPQLTFSGKEERRKNWYEDMNIIDIMVNKYGDYNATAIRKAILDSGEEDSTGEKAYEYLMTALPYGINNSSKITLMREILKESTNKATASV